MPNRNRTGGLLLRNRLKDLYRAFDSLDIDRTAPFYSKAPGIVIFNDVGPVSFAGWKEFSRAERVVMAKFSRWKTTARNLKISEWEDAALTTCTPTLVGEYKTGKQAQVKLRHTAVWEKESNQWMIVHDHWSFVRP